MRVLPRVVQGFLVGENDIIFFDLMKVVILFVPKSNLIMVSKKKIIKSPKTEGIHIYNEGKQSSSFFLRENEGDRYK